MKRVKKFILILFCLLLVSTIAYAVLFPHIIRGILIEQSDFEEIADRVFVSPETSIKQRDSLLAFLDTAHSRNENFWGKRIAYPKVVFCHTHELAKKYGYTGSPASFFMTPFFSFVMIAPEGLHPDIISHEMCHPELYYRAGWIKHTLDFPVWFFEGVAMQVDHREFYSEASWRQITHNGVKAPSLSEMHDLKGFFQGDFQTNYATAKHEVARWLQITGQEGLEKLIEETSSNNDFYEVYNRIENEN